MARTRTTKSLFLCSAALAVCLFALSTVQAAESASATAEKPEPEAPPPPPPPTPPPPPPPATSKPNSSAPKQEKTLNKKSKGSSVTPTLSSMVSKAKHDVDHFLHSEEAHIAKSALVMSDVGLVMTGIQLQLSIVHENYLAAKLAGAGAESHHQHMAHVHHEREQLCAQGSILILAILLVENLAAMWAQGPKKFFKKTAQGVDFFIVATSLWLELIFEKITGANRLFAEWWRFVRIVHGAYETFFHSPIVAPLFNPNHGHGGGHH